jgi:hypothetical protein
MFGKHRNFLICVTQLLPFKVGMGGKAHFMAFKNGHFILQNAPRFTISILFNFKRTLSGNFRTLNIHKLTQPTNISGKKPLMNI